VNRKELSAVIAECAEVTQRAAARTEAARAGVEVARKRQEEATARQEAATARWQATQADAAERSRKLDAMVDEVRADRKRREVEWEEEKAWRQEFLRRQEKMFQHHLQRADRTLAEFKQETVEIKKELADQRDERKAFREALMVILDRLPPPPPDLRSA
jgi:DNA-directed RNA polymerase beta' subunit